MHSLLRSCSRITLPARLLFVCGLLVQLLFILSLHFGWLNALFNDSMHRFGPGADFFSIYAAGVKARHGQSLYTIAADGVPYAYAFRYAPIVAYTLGTVLSLLPAVSAYAVWIIVCEWALMRNIRLTLEHAPDKATGYLAASMWLLFSPFYLELYIGQFTFVTASLVFWSYLAWQPRPPATSPSRLSAWWGDGLFGLSVWLKLMPVLFLPLALFRGRWKSALGAAAVLFLSSWLYFSHRPAGWMLFRLLNTMPLPTWHAGNQGLMALAYSVLNEQAAPFLAFYYAAVLIVVALLAWLTARTWQAKKEEAQPLPLQNSVDTDAEEASTHVAPVFEYRLLLLYAACSAAYLLLYKDVWEHHYVLLLPPLVLLALRKAPVSLWLPSFVIAAVPTLFVLYDVHGLGFNEDPQGYWRPGVSLLHHGFKPLSALWLLMGTVSQSLPALPVAIRTLHTGRAWRHRFAFGFLIFPVLGFGLLARWAKGAIAEQRHGVQERVLAPPVFQTQRHRNTCGPAALATVCRYYGIDVDEDEIAQRAGTTEAGTSVMGLQQAAQQKGLSALGRRIRLSELGKTPLPCILYFHPGHFVILTGVQQHRLYLADPSSGQQVWTVEQLQHVWRGELLVIGPAEKLP